MSNNKKVVIFDFDCTLTILHAFHMFNTKNYKNIILPDEITNFFINYRHTKKFQKINNIDIIKNLFFGNEVRILFLLNLFKFLTTNNYILIIASRGTYDIINYLLTLMDFRKYFKIIKDNKSLNVSENIINDIISDDNYNFTKDKFIEQLFTKNVDIIYYFDDDNTEFNNLKFTKINEDEKSFSCFTYNNKKLIFYKDLIKEGLGISYDICTLFDLTIFYDFDLYIGELLFKKHVKEQKNIIFINFKNNKYILSIYYSLTNKYSDLILENKNILNLTIIQNYSSYLIYDDLYYKPIIHEFDSKESERLLKESFVDNNKIYFLVRKSQNAITELNKDGLVFSYTHNGSKIFKINASGNNSVFDYKYITNFLSKQNLKQYIEIKI